MAGRATYYLLLGCAGLTVGVSTASAQTPLDPEIVLATTTSVRDAGLLDALLPPFERATGHRIKLIAVGSGQAMALGRLGEADLLIVHAPEQELEFVRQGFAVARRPLMHNEFVLVGPAPDPADVRGLPTLDALRAVARAGARFVSRADRSGTHVKERRLWRLAGVEPDGRWYRESGQGMSATLQIANQIQAYTLTDIGTFLTHRYPLDLEILVEGDSLLANPYHVLLVNADRFPWLNGAGARRLTDYLLSAHTQARIAAFGIGSLGRPLFAPAAPGRE
jgi:tungstate transport system substrate-binding protein